MTKNDIKFNSTQQLLFVLVLCAFSGFVTTSYCLKMGSLYWDNERFYSFFYDNLHSLNYFGEPAWWFPHNQFGFPGYYYSIVGDLNGAAPAFMSLAVIFRLLGSFGIRVSSIQPVYVLYFGGLIPTIFLIGVWLLARQLFRSNTVVAFILILAAFSPGVILNLTDVGFLEPTAYSLYFAAAYIKFINTPGRKAFLMLVLSLLVLAVSFNYTSLAWNILFIPLLILCSAISVGSFERIKKSFCSLPARYWMIALILVIVCLSPSMITFSQGKSLGITHARPHSFITLKPGNPLEVLTASTPGMGFEWDVYSPNPNSPRPQFLPYPLEKFVAYTYLGLLALPLSVVGLIFGRYSLRFRLLAMFSAMFSIFILSAYSPIFALTLVLPSPLVSFDHFSDLLYRSGGFLILIFSAGLGLETILRSRQDLRKIMALCFAFFALTSVGFYLYLYRGLQLGTIFGFMLLMILMFFAVIVSLANTSIRVRQNNFCVLLLFLTLVDVSTVAFWHVRTLMYTGANNYDAPADDSIGIKNPQANIYANSLLKLDRTAALEGTGLPLELLPRFTLFHFAHTYTETPDKFDFNAATSSDNLERSLALPEEATRVDAFKPFFDTAIHQQGTLGKVRVISLSYNSFRLQVASTQPALLFVRDAYSSYWTATVNGIDVPLTRALGNFKAIAVPSGESEVYLHFSPPGVGLALLLAYIEIAVVTILLCLDSIQKVFQKNWNSIRGKGPAHGIG